jgi:hypothetical protein
MLIVCTLAECHQVASYLPDAYVYQQREGYITSCEYSWQVFSEIFLMRCTLAFAVHGRKTGVPACITSVEFRAEPELIEMVHVKGLSRYALQQAPERLDNRT